MIGKKDSVGKLFYQFSLDERVPQDHLLRRIAATVDFSFVRRMTKRFYSHTGQPSIDPIVIFKMALLSYLYGITSERRLIEEIKLNLAYLWFIGYDLDEAVPDHSVLSKARTRYGLTVYQGFFKEIVRQCEQAGLVQGNRLYADSTLVQANADPDSLGSRALLGQLPAIGDHLTKLWEDNSESAPPASECPSAPSGRRPLPRPVTDSSGTPAEPEQARSLPGEGSPWNPRPGIESSVAGVADVAGSPDAIEPAAIPGAADQITQSAVLPRLHVAGEADLPNKAVGLLNERMVSRVDPEAELVRRARVPAGLYYKIHATVDGGQARIVTAVEVTGGGIADEHLLERLIREHEGNVGRRPDEVGADAKYGTAENYQMLERLGILGSIPLRSSSADSRTVPAATFTYDPKTDSFRCPNGERLRRQGLTTETAAVPLIIYRAKAKQCAVCPLKAECCGSAKARSVSRPDDGGRRARVAAYLRTFRARQTIRRRKAWIETIFGDGKERRGQRRARCRGLDKMRVQAWMIGMAQNIRQLALRKTTRPGIGVNGLEKDSRGAHLVPLSLCRLDANAHHNLTLWLALN
jgi:transposase